MSKENLNSYKCGLSEMEDNSISVGTLAPHDDWKLSRRVTPKVVLERLNQRENYRELSQNAIASSSTSKKNVDTVKISESQANSELEVVQHSPHPILEDYEEDFCFTPDDLLAELHQIVLNSVPDCRDCSRLIFKLGKHIRGSHPTSPPSSPTRNQHKDTPPPPAAQELEATSNQSNLNSQVSDSDRPRSQSNRTLALKNLLQNPKSLKSIHFRVRDNSTEPGHALNSKKMLPTPIRISSRPNLRKRKPTNYTELAEGNLCEDEEETLTLPSRSTSPPSDPGSDEQEIIEDVKSIEIPILHYTHEDHSLLIVQNIKDEPWSEENEDAVMSDPLCAPLSTLSTLDENCDLNERGEVKEKGQRRGENDTNSDSDYEPDQESDVSDEGPDLRSTPHPVRGPSTSALEPNECKVCHKNYSSPWHLKRHSLLHRRKRVQQKTQEPIQDSGTQKLMYPACDICGKHFATLYHLNRHKLTHQKANFYLDKKTGQIKLKQYPQNKSIRKVENSKTFLAIIQSKASEKDPVNINPAVQSNLEEDNSTGMTLAEDDTLSDSNSRSGVSLDDSNNFFIATNTNIVGDNLSNEISEMEIADDNLSNRDSDGDSRGSDNNLVGTSSAEDNPKPKPDLKPVLSKRHICHCGKSFPQAAKLKMHSLVHVGETPLECEICHAKFKHAYTLQLHRRIHTGEKERHACETCGKKFIHYKYLVIHKKIHTVNLQCETCHQHFDVLEDLNEHEKTHEMNDSTAKEKPQPDSGSGPGHEGESKSEKNYNKIDTQEKHFPCKHCPRQYLSKYPLMKHTRKHHPQAVTKLKCHYCDDHYLSEHILKCHVKEDHPGKMPFQCTSCPKGFVTSKLLVLHNQIHNGERLFKCSKCDKKYKKREELKLHFFIHTGERLFECDQCDKAYISSDRLKNHKRIHTGEKPFMCEHCSKCFSRKGGLNLHMAVHKVTEDGERVKPHVCGECGASFTKKHHLRNHELVHTGKKTHMCEECGNCFRLPAHLRAHLKTHNKKSE